MRSREAVTTAAPDPYGVMARYYDANFASLRGGADIAFYRELAVASRGPVLELGAGSGRVLLPIAATGIPVTGLDVSAAMLARLRSRPFPPTLRLVNAPMQDFDLDEDRFTLIYSAFRALQHLLSVEDQLACLACVRRHLAPGGAFAFDVLAPTLGYLARPSPVESDEGSFELEGDTVMRRSKLEYDLARQLIQGTVRYERTRDGKVVAVEEAPLTLRYYFRYELEHLLARAGFTRVEFFGGFDRRPYDYVSSETVVVARL